MARARRIPAQVPPPPPDNILLELTPREAAVLAKLTDHVGGDLIYSAREATDAIGRALRGVGIATEPNLKTFSGSINAVIGQ